MDRKPLVVTVKTWLDTPEQIKAVEKQAKLRCGCIECQGDTACNTSIAGLLGWVVFRHVKDLSKMHADTECYQEEQNEKNTVLPRSKR